MIQKPKKQKPTGKNGKNSRKKPAKPKYRLPPKSSAVIPLTNGDSDRRRMCHMLTAIQTLFCVLPKHASFCKPQSALSNVWGAYLSKQSCEPEIKQLMKKIRIRNDWGSFDLSWERLLSQLTKDARKKFTWGAYGKSALLKAHGSNLEEAFKKSFQGRSAAILDNIPECANTARTITTVVNVF